MIEDCTRIILSNLGFGATYPQVCRRWEKLWKEVIAAYPIEVVLKNGIDQGSFEQLCRYYSAICAITVYKSTITNMSMARGVRYLKVYDGANIGVLPDLSNVIEFVFTRLHVEPLQKMPNVRDVMIDGSNITSLCGTDNATYVCAKLP